MHSPLPIQEQCPGEKRIWEVGGQAAQRVSSSWERKAEERAGPRTDPEDQPGRTCGAGATAEAMGSGD